MNKLFLIAFLAIGIVSISAQLTPAQQTIQSFLTGVYTENKLTLPNPSTLVQCFDPTTAQNTVTFIGQILPKLASASITDLTSLIKQIENFTNSIPEPVKNCLGNNSEIDPLEAAYGISANTNWAALLPKIISYLTLHFSAVHKQLQAINSSWQSTQYQQAGSQLASLAHNILGQSNLAAFILTQLTPGQQIIQEVLNGVYTQNHLANSTTIATCFDATTAQNIVNFVGQILPEAAKGSISDYMNIVKQVEAFAKTIPSGEVSCLENNPQLDPLEKAYGISSTTNWSKLEQQIISYITFHFSTVQKAIKGINAQWLASNYYQAGFQTAQLAHQILGEKLSQALSPEQILQQAFNGIFEENNLQDPTTVVQCFDPATAQNIVNFAGQILPKAASGSLSDLISLIKQIQAFGDSIPPSVSDCLSNNAELKTLGAAYGIDDNTNSNAIITKIISYITFHYPALHKAIQNLNNLWQQQNYYQVGFQAGVLGHTILGLSSTNLQQSSSTEILQLLFNGIFEENHLPDPTTAVQCFDPTTAANAVNFINTALPKAAKGSIADLISVIKSFQQFDDSIPADVKACLKANQELIALGNAYGLSPDTKTDVIIAKIVSYVTFHYPATHKAIVAINDLWTALNYFQVGYQAGALGHQILGLDE